MTLKNIERQAKSGDFDSAIAACNALLKDNAIDQADILRTRAYVYSLSQDHESALRDRSQVLEVSNGELKDYYLAADAALFLCRYELAEGYLTTLLEQAERDNEQWFNSSAWFLLAYIQMNLGRRDAATKSLDTAESYEKPCVVSVPGFSGLMSADYLRKRINDS